jgi:hypothetical protein
MDEQSREKALKKVFFFQYGFILFPLILIKIYLGRIY